MGVVGLVEVVGVGVVVGEQAGVVGWHAHLLLGTLHQAEHVLAKVLLPCGGGAVKPPLPLIPRCFPRKLCRPCTGGRVLHVHSMWRQRRRVDGREEGREGGSGDRGVGAG